MSKAKDWEKALRPRQELFLATSSKDGKPHVIVVISMGLSDGKLLIGVCLMKKTLKNIKENNRLSILVKDDGQYFRIDGKATLYSSGKYFDLVYQNSHPPMPKQALAIDIEEVFDLVKMQKVA